MGLDTVELIMEVEETFSLTIPNEDAATLVTAGDLRDYLLHALPVVQGPGPCRTQEAFYRLRQGIQAALDVPRSRLRPTTRLEELLPEASRKSAWREVGRKARLSPWPRAVTWRGNVSRDNATLGAIARTLASSCCVRSPGPWTRDELEAELTRIICTQIDVASFEWTDSFIQDLGMD